MKRIYAVHAAYGEEMDKLEARVVEGLYEKGAYAISTSDDAYDSERPYKVINGIALYDIKGKMLSSGNWITQFLGIPTYDEIANTLAQMAEDEEVEQVLVHMDTPGGNVAGISDVSDAWRRLNAVKPITVHTPGILASAGIWIASNSSKIYASETADVGSIGVIIQHLSYQEALKKEGIDVTQIKSAPMKHIGSPAKNLTTEDKEYLQKKVDESDALFKKQLYTTRPQILTEAFSGATFSASESQRLGLIDGVMTFSAVFEQLSASAGSDNNLSYKEEFSMKRKVTQAMAEAAISAGADPNSLEIVSQESYDTLTPEERTAVEETAEITEDVETEASVVEEEEVNPLTAQVEELTTELASANSQVEVLTVQVADLTGKLEKSASDPLRMIAEDRIQHLRVALGLSKIDLGAFSTESIIADYNALNEQFTKLYKPGGHAPAKKTEKPTEQPKVTSIESARLRAVGV